MPAFRQHRHLVALALAALAALVTLPSLAGAEGMSIDPNGRTMASANPSHPSGESGMQIDPDSVP